MTKTIRKFGLVWLLCCAPILAFAQTAADSTSTTNNSSFDAMLLKAYEGDQESQFKVGEMFAIGASGAADQEQANYWYQKAADQGSVLAQYNLGHHYLNGIGVDKNIGTAMQWWLKAAKQNHVLAQFNVGRAYYLGIGLPEDAKSAKYWFERAAENKEPRSIAILKKLDSSSSIKTAAAASEEEKLKSVITPTVVSQTSPALKPAEQPNATAATTPATKPQPVAVAPVTTKPAPAKPQAIATVETPPKPTPPPAVAVKSPILLFTNPAVSSISIAELADQDNLKVTKAGKEWSQVQSISGFPVWIHGDFLKTDNNKHGTVSGTSVNARANPEVAAGSVIGRFTKGDRVLVLEQRDAWYQVISPSHFKAWAKTADLKN